MAKAPIEKTWVFPGFEDVEAGIVHWPMSCIRLTCADDARLVELADKLLAAWRSYTDESCFIFAETDGEPHNTITPIARMRDGKYQLDLVLRNNITTPEHPLGVYHLSLIHISIFIVMAMSGIWGGAVVTPVTGSLLLLLLHLLVDAFQDKQQHPLRPGHRHHDKDGNGCLLCACRCV